MHACSLKTQYALAEADARFHLKKPEEEIAKKRRLRHEVIRHNLEKLQDRTLLLHKECFVTAEPTPYKTESYKPVCSSFQQSNCVTVELARFVKRQWSGYLSVAQANPLLKPEKRQTIYCHPKSILYSHDREFDLRGEMGLVHPHLAIIFARLYGAADPTYRDSALTFTCHTAKTNLTEHDLWGGYPCSSAKDGEKAADVCLPDASYTLSGLPIQVFFPPVFRWGSDLFCLQFLLSLDQRMKSTGIAYELWCPGLLPYQA